VDFFEKKHHYPIHYVGNPTAQEVRTSGTIKFLETYVLS
jgi:lipid-A-disaccharide synthase